MTGQMLCGLACASQQGVQRAAAGRLQVQVSGLLLRPAAHVREDGPSSSSRGYLELLRPPRRGSPRPLVYFQSSEQLGPLDSQKPSRSSSPLLPHSSVQVPAVSAGGVSFVAPADGVPSAQLLSVQEQGGASLLQLVATWDRLAARLPPQASAGRAAELILSALKLALAYAPPPLPPSTSPQQPALSRPMARALSLASRLADLAATGLPIDAESIAAGILAELFVGPAQPQPAWSRHAAAASGSTAGGALTLQVVEERVGPIVAQLVHDIQRARQLPARVELLDDTAARALRELCLSFYDVRATAVEVVSRLDVLSSSDGLPSYEQQVCALEALQMYAPMGHALGLSAVAVQLEDRCFQILFPESYLRTAAWLREQAAANADTLARCQAALADAVLAQPRFSELASGLSVKGRTKTLFSTLKKLLRLGNTAAGGRARAQLYDLMGLRAVVQPRANLPPEEAEALAAQACYLVRDVASELWQPLSGRCKDYVAAPKSNGYQSLHSTVRVLSDAVGLDGGSSGYATLELQIRTQAMDDQAERGEAAHGAYKGGLDAAQALQLKSVTDSVLWRTAAAAAHSTSALASANCAGVGSNGGMLGTSDAAAEGLFCHLDRNGDGRISLEELQFALQELGVCEAQAQSAAAAELLQLAAADGDEDGVEGGTIGYDAFMAFQRRVGLLQALSAVDHQQAEELEELKQQQKQQGAGEGSSLSSLVSSLSSLAAGSDGTGRLWGSSSGASGSGKLAAGACQAQGHSSTLRWQQQGTGQQLGGGGLAGRRRGSSVVARAFLETSCASCSANNSSIDKEAGSGSKSTNGTNGALAGSTSRIGSGAFNSVVSLKDRRGAGASGSSPHAAKPAPNAAPTASSGHLLSKPTRAVPPPEHAASSDQEGSSGKSIDWGSSQAVQGILRLVTPSGLPPADASWQLVAAPTNPHQACNAAGCVVPALVGAQGSGVHVQALRMPELGPCVIGAMSNRDCDYVLDVPTLSARHALLEVVCRSDLRRGHSKLVLTDLGSTNGTWVNRARIQPYRQVMLHPGDVVYLAGGDVAFEVQVLLDAPPAPCDLASNGGMSSAAAVESAPVVATGAAAEAGVSSSGCVCSPGNVAAAQQAAATLPAVVAALQLARALEAAAAEQGHFPPGGAIYADLPDRARWLMTAGSYEEAHALLLAGAMRQPWDGALWAQLGNLERQRARRGKHGSSYAVSRAFFGAAAACFGGLTAESAGGTACAEAERVEGVSRVLGSWAQLELAMGHLGPARSLFRKAVATARQHPVPATAASAAARLLFTWAHREWKGGEASVALRLCCEALNAEPANAYALCLLGNLEAEAGQARVARHLFERALEARPGFVTALQSMGRLEASRGYMDRARQLFQQAIRLEPTNTHVLQAWAVAEARHGAAAEARSLFRRCTMVDPACRAAWHGWAKLEEEAWNVEEARRLYQTVLQLKPDSVPALSALGHLERRVGELDQAAALLEAALKVDPHHVQSVQELSLVRRAQGRNGDAQRLRGIAWRLNACRRASMREVAVAKVPAAIRAVPPPGSQPSPA